jgi:flagella basal body P-ring formation protein FlgA
VLREHATPQGPVVRLGDVADQMNAGPIAEQLAATPLMPAPPEGTQQYLRNSELRDLLVARGVDVRSLRFTGSDAVLIGHTAPASTPNSDPAASTSSTDIGERINAAAVGYLRQQTGHDLWKVTVDPDDNVIAAMQQAAGNVLISGGKAPWTGRQRLAVSAGPGSPAVMAYARIERLELAVFATREIDRGELVRRSDVELRPFAGALPNLAVASFESAVGKEAVQPIRAGSLVIGSQVRSPIIVRRGERVSVRARAAGVSVRTYAVAQQDGSLGELVMVQSLAGKEKYAARVSGLRELEILAASASASDLAAATQPELR